MRDVEIMLRFFAFRYHLKDYTGNLKSFLDGTVNTLNDAWEQHEDEIKEVGQSCEKAIQVTFEIFGDNSFYRWSDGDYEGRFNRAVFDVMTHYFSDEGIAAAAIAHGDDVEAAFKRICEQDSKFVESIQTTTKTPVATHRRLSTWGTELASIIGIPVPIPGFSGNRILT